MAVVEIAAGEVELTADGSTDLWTATDPGVYAAVCTLGSSVDPTDSFVLKWRIAGFDTGTLRELTFATLNDASVLAHSPPVIIGWQGKLSLDTDLVVSTDVFLEWTVYKVADLTML